MNKIIKKIKQGIMLLMHGEQKTIAEIISLSPSELLKNRCALITGGTSGIGFSIAETYLKANATVIITGRNKNRVDQAVAKLAKYGKVMGFVLDNSQIQDFSTTLKSILNTISHEKINYIDILQQGFYFCLLMKSNAISALDFANTRRFFIRFKLAWR